MLEFQMTIQHTRSIILSDNVHCRLLHQVALLQEHGHGIHPCVIHFDATSFSEMKDDLDSFYFKHFLPSFFKNSNQTHTVYANVFKY